MTPLFCHFASPTFVTLAMDSPEGPRTDVFMKLGRQIPAIAFVICSIVPCFAHHLAVVVDKDNKIENVTSAHLVGIVKSEIKKWPDGKEVVLVLHKGSGPEMLTLERLTHMSATELQLSLANHKTSITTVESDQELLNLVQSTPGALGFVDVRVINDHVKVVKVDGKLPLEGGYLPHQ
jgi:ABC-type phosphate transport system substrate-binding protein